MSKEKPSISQVLAANKSFVTVLLGLPVIGMVIAVILILYKRPESTVLALGVIFFIAVQYIIMMYLFMKRVESLAKKKDEQQARLAEESVQDSIPEPIPEPIKAIQEQPRINKEQLLTEEQRIFDTEKDENKKNIA